MAITLYDATVPNYLQILRSLRGVLEKGLAHAQATGVDPDSLVEARLAEDMFPLSFQVQRVADHSAGALRDVSQGAFSFPSKDRFDYAGLQTLIADAETAVSGWTREAVNALEGREVLFDTGRSPARTFTAEAFLFSFSLPNFHFHAVTAYGILRMKGAPIGKMDYLGQLRTNL
ncbi:DUF1993 domain-containing protein [Phenylobacterium sp. LjRoot225]|uniref:DUF1993 domain-containing protein n=1 Tax=Phenylobacterium sp. LjRoot225 TaxID=3342285 RepID=UPI003ECC58C5